jgi:hypothetical protein
VEAPEFRRRKLLIAFRSRPNALACIIREGHYEAGQVAEGGI